MEVAVSLRAIVTSGVRVSILRRRRRSMNLKVDLEKVSGQIEVKIFQPMSS